MRTHRWTITAVGMAERVGFEPTVELPRQQFSRLPDSAALAPLRDCTLNFRWDRINDFRESIEASLLPGHKIFKWFSFHPRVGTMGRLNPSKRNDDSPLARNSFSLSAG